MLTEHSREVECNQGQTNYKALNAPRVDVQRNTAKRHEPRGIFCAIGRCTDCVMVVDGKPNVRTCMTPLAAGMDVRTQNGVAPLDLDDPRAEALVAEAAASPAAVREDE